MKSCPSVVAPTQQLQQPDPSLKDAFVLILLTDVVLMEFLSLLVLTSKDVKTVLLLTLVSQQKLVHCQRKEEPVETTQLSGHTICLMEDAFVSGSEDAEAMLIDTNHRKSVKGFVLILRIRGLSSS